MVMMTNCECLPVHNTFRKSEEAEASCVMFFITVISVGAEVFGLGSFGAAMIALLDIDRVRGLPVQWVSVCEASTGKVERTLQL